MPILTSCRNHSGHILKMGGTPHWAPWAVNSPLINNLLSRYISAVSIIGRWHETENLSSKINLDFSLLGFTYSYFWMKIHIALLWFLGLIREGVSECKKEKKCNSWAKTCCVLVQSVSLPHAHLLSYQGKPLLGVWAIKNPHVLEHMPSRDILW